jgi:hypothetical protein
MSKSTAILRKQETCGSGYEKSVSGIHGSEPPLDQPATGSDTLGINANSIAHPLVHIQVKFVERVGEQTRRQRPSHLRAQHK